MAQNTSFQIPNTTFGLLLEGGRIRKGTEPQGSGQRGVLCFKGRPRQFIINMEKENDVCEISSPSHLSQEDKQKRFFYISLSILILFIVIGIGSVVYLWQYNARLNANQDRLSKCIDTDHSTSLCEKLFPTD